MTVYTSIECCASDIFNYLTITELFDYAYKQILSNKLIHKSIIYNINKYKTNSIIYKKLLSKKYSEQFIFKCPIYNLNSYDPKMSFHTYIDTIMAKNNNLPHKMFFLINKLYKVFFIQEINKETCIFISQSFITNVYYTFIKQKTVHTTKRFIYTNNHGYIYKDKQYTNATNEILSLLKNE